MYRVRTDLGPHDHANLLSKAFETLKNEAGLKRTNRVRTDSWVARPAYHALNELRNDQKEPIFLVPVYDGQRVS